MIPHSALQFPKKIIHIGKEWDIILDDGYDGASWSSEKSTLRIGTGGQPMEIFERIFHEIFEMQLMAQFCRFYSNHADDNHLFVVDHRQFQAALELSMPVALQFLKFDFPKEDNLMDRFVEEICGDNHQ